MGRRGSFSCEKYHPCIFHLRYGIMLFIETDKKKRTMPAHFTPGPSFHRRCFDCFPSVSPNLKPLFSMKAKKEENNSWYV